MPAFGAAIGLGASEIEFDIWPTADGEIVSCHDATLERVSNGEGKIYEKTYAELLELDFGVKHGEKFAGIKIPTFEEILKKFGGRCVMNVHVKTLSDEYDEAAMKKIVALVRKYDCAKHVYFMISHDGVIEQFKAYAPDIPICVGHLGSRPDEIVERAIEHGCYKVQLFKSSTKRYFDRETVEFAHKNGILCNVFYADDPEESKMYLDWGIDTVLTNDYLAISNATGVK
jgi:glycerophosphoryl diester phosphodiesterase